MLTATVVVLAVLLGAVALLVAVALLNRRRSVRRQRTGQELPDTGGFRPAAAGTGPALGSPAQVWLERGERIAGRLRDIAATHPLLAGVADDADDVLAELRAAASEVAALDAARARLPAAALAAERQRIDTALAAAAGGPAEVDLRMARDAVAARSALAARHRAAVDALLTRMRAAVAGLEHAADELTALLTLPGEVAGAAPPTLAGAALAGLGDRLAGLRSGLAEVRAVGEAVLTSDSGFHGDVPDPAADSVERPPPT